MAKSKKSGHLSLMNFSGFKDAVMTYTNYGKTLKSDGDMSNGLHGEVRAKGSKKSKK